MKQEPILVEGDEEKERVLERLKLKKWKESVRNWVWKMKWRRVTTLFSDLSRLG